MRQSPALGKAGKHTSVVPNACHLLVEELEHHLPGGLDAITGLQKAVIQAHNIEPAWHMHPAIQRHWGCRCSRAHKAHVWKLHSEVVAHTSEAIGSVAQPMHEDARGRMQRRLRRDLD